MRNRLYSQYSPGLLQLEHGSVAEIAAEAYRLECAHDKLEPHRILADLPFPIYITSTPFSLIAIALRQIGKHPAEICDRPSGDMGHVLRNTDLDTDLTPTVERPVVYHLFGNIAIPDSLVLTEDDFLDQLTSRALRKDSIPHRVRRALVNTTLLLIGHRVNERNFQFMLRILLSSPGSSALRRFRHIVQCTPQVTQQAQPSWFDLVRERGGLHFTVYSGDPAHFLDDLRSRSIFPIDSRSRNEKQDGTVPTKETTEEHQLTQVSAWNFQSGPVASNPYAGPRPLRPGDGVYGRDAQVSEVLSLILVERVVVLYGKAGVGKTSMVDAGLIPQLETKDFAVYPGIRMTIAPHTGDVSPNSNPYVWSVLSALCHSIPSEKRFATEELGRLTLIDGLNHLLPADRRAVLVFDQFEEIISLDSNDDSRQSEFFRQLGIVLRNHRYYALFVVREDYFGSIQPFARLLPTGLGAQFRLMPLNPEEAVAAIREPARRRGVEFSPSAVQILVDGLRHVRIHTQDGALGSVVSAYIEPVTLQILCRELWNQLPADVRTIDEKTVGSFDYLGSALARYYDDAIERTSRLTGVSEQVLRNWFDGDLITEDGLRTLIAQKDIESQGVPKSVVNSLIDSYLVREELRNDMIWVELASDRLVETVRASNTKWYAAHLFAVEQEARRWEQEGRPASLLLQGGALREAEEWVASHPEVSPLLREFLAISRGVKASSRRGRPGR